MTVRLRKEVSTRKPVGRSGYNGNGTHNGNGASEAKVAKKKKTTAAKKAEVIEEPVTIKVIRTVKKKYQDEAAQEIRPTSTQENPGDPKDEDEEIDLENIEVRRFLVEPARVNYHYSVGRNVHFQSINVGCSVTIPCYKEEVEGALVEAKKLVADRLKVELKKADGVLDYIVNQRIEKDQDLVKRGIR